MLIKCDRHTKKDIKAYKQYVEIDNIHIVKEERIIEAKNICKMFKGGAAYTSWGKDSVVMLSFVHKYNNSIPVVWWRIPGYDNPECEKVRDFFLSKYDINYHERDYDYIDIVLKERHWIELQKEFGVKRLVGIRSDESKKRLLSSIVHGFNNYNSWRPLLNWRNKDIFAYIEKFDLPLNPSYGCIGGGRWKRESIRTHCLYGLNGQLNGRGSGIGKNEWEKEYFSEEIRRIIHNEHS